MVKTFEKTAKMQTYLMFQQGYSFSHTTLKEMSYGQFLALQQQEKSPGSFVLKDDRREGGLIEKIIGDIELPEFYHDISELEGIELI